MPQACSVILGYRYVLDVYHDGRSKFVLDEIQRLICVGITGAIKICKLFRSATHGSENQIFGVCCIFSEKRDYFMIYKWVRRGS